jgi:hypothetical protein
MSRRAGRPDLRNEPKPQRSFLTEHRTAVIVAVIAALGLVTAAALPLLLNRRGDADTCKTSQRVSVDAPRDVGASYTVTIKFRCAPEADQSYVWIGELQNVGSDKHSVYYWTKDAIPLQPKAGQSTTWPGDLRRSPVGTTYLLYVLSVPSDEVLELGQNTLKTGGELDLPDGSHVVSNQSYITRES